jgi:septal ring factor EnvC (AmiA/AmiB activator)
LTAAQAVSPTRQSETSVAEPVADSSTSIAETPTAPSSLVKPAPMKHPTAKRRAPTDKRYTQLQTQLAEQEKQLKDTQQQVEKYRSDLEGNINSTRDELNGSIAKTHEELVALEKRGERNYYEFDLSKSKQFERVGPLSLSLRKADTKHKSYDLAMIVDDNQLTKKQVNLYEPISIHIENESQPMMVVVNRIEKNIVHGYISAPKYKASELASAAAAAVAPPAGSAPAVDNNRNSQPPPQP